MGTGIQCIREMVDTCGKPHDQLDHLYVTKTDGRIVECLLAFIEEKRPRSIREKRCRILSCERWLTLGQCPPPGLTVVPNASLCRSSRRRILRSQRGRE